MSKRKISLIIMSIFVLGLLLALIPIPSNSYSGGNEDAFGRPISSYMVGTHYADSITLPTQPNTTIDLPTDWSIQHTNITVYELVDSHDFIINGTFDSGSGTSSPPWSYGEVDPGNLADGSWVSGSPLAGNMCVYAEIPHPGGVWVTYPEGTKAFWSATFTVPRGTIYNAVLDLWYYADFASTFDRDEFRAYAEIEGHIVWSRGLYDIANSGERNTWIHLTLNVFKDINGQPVFNLPSDQNITVEIGIRYASGTANYNFDATNNRIYYDNVSLTLTAEVNPTQIALAVTDPNSNTHNITSSSYGNGTVSFDGVFGPATQPVFEQITYTYSSNSSDIVTFKNNITVEVSHIWETTTVTFSVSNGSDVSWVVKFLTELNVDNEPKGTGPTIYTDYYLNLTLPLDWNVSEITDPTGGSHNANDTNYMLYSNSTNKILVIDVNAIDIYGLYTVDCSSPNYIKSIQLQVYQSGVWVNSDYFVEGDTVRFIAKISNESGNPPVDLGNGSLQILDPDNHNWPAVELSTVVNSSGYIISDNVTISGSDLIGAYTIEFGWNNGYEAGLMSTTQFGKKGPVDFTINYPGASQPYFKAGESFSLEVTLTDSVTGLEVSDAVLQYHASWQASGVWTTIPKLPDGPYSVNIMTSSALNAGVYTLQFRVTHDWYTSDNAPESNISIWRTGHIGVQVQKYDNGTWTNVTVFGDNDTIRILTWIVDDYGSPPDDSGSVSITIIDSTRRLWPSIDPINVTVLPGGVAYSESIDVPD
ncbi:MAG: hypothetical protein ACTSYR_05455, partial [Candidatus Odinarchaeia archaeon]